MTPHLCLSVTYLDQAFHGRRDGGQPEWPPSPLRLFQALVAAAAARWGERQQLDYARPALRWLEAQPPPVIVCPPAQPGSAYRLSVPNNAMDLVGRAWSRGNTAGSGDANPATHRAMKTVRPTQMLRGDAVHFLWELPDPVPEDVCGYVEVLSAAARSLVALGWGVDLVAGYGRVATAKEAAELPGERWQPSAPAAEGLRVPTPGTLDALVSRQKAFLHRLGGDGLTPVAALTAFAVVGYRTATSPPHRPFAAFELWQPADKLATLPAGKSRFRPFDPLRGAVRVAAMVRHAADEAARATGWPAERISEYVHGHGPGGPARGAPDTPRFAYLPLPSVEERPRKEKGRTTVVSAIRRVLVVEPPGGTGERVAWARRALSGRELTDGHTGRPAALLSLIPGSDPRVRHYLGGATGSPTWSTVTPVVLPGHDDHGSPKAERLLRKAIQQAGLSATLAENAELEWRNVGFLPGVDLALRYEPPAHINAYTRYHVRVRWRGAAGEPVAVRGPIVIGAGRYCGFGVFVADEQ
jgi:CRISPR-associated protein Csb2